MYCWMVSSLLLFCSRDIEIPEMDSGTAPLFHHILQLGKVLDQGRPIRLGQFLQWIVGVDLG